MAQRVVTTCDLCDDDGIERAGQPTLLRVDETQAIVDLCDEHRSVFVAPVTELLDRFGRPEGRASIVKPAGARPVSSAPRPDKKGSGTYRPVPSRARSVDGLVYPCPLDGRVFTNGTTLHTHIEREHDVKASDYAAWLQAKCRACDLRPMSPQGLARHIQTEHDQPNSAALVAHLAHTDPERVAGIVNALIRGTSRLHAQQAEALANSGNVPLFAAAGHAPATGSDQAGDH